MLDLGGKNFKVISSSTNSQHLIYNQRESLSVLTIPVCYLSPQSLYSVVSPCHLACLLRNQYGRGNRAEWHPESSC